MNSEKRTPGPWKLAEQISADGVEEFVVSDANGDVMFRISINTVEVSGNQQHRRAVAITEADGQRENEQDVPQKARRQGDAR